MYSKDFKMSKIKRPKPKSKLRRIMFWASCYKWDMYMYKKYDVRYHRNHQ